MALSSWRCARVPRALLQSARHFGEEAVPGRSLVRCKITQNDPRRRGGRGV